MLEDTPMFSSECPETQVLLARCNCDSFTPCRLRVPGGTLFGGKMPVLLLMVQTVWRYDAIGGGSVSD